MVFAAADSVEALCTHLRANPTTIDLQHQVAERSVRQIEVPHVLESTLIDLPGCRVASDRTSERIATVCDTGHLLHNVERSLQQRLMALIRGDGLFHVHLDRLPDVVERGLGGCQLASVMV